MSASTTHPTAVAPLALPLPPPRRRSPVVIQMWWVLPAVLYLIAFFVMPLVQNAGRSFRLPSSQGGAWTLAFYEKLLTDPYYLGILGQTILLSLVVTLICIVIGYPIAIFLVRYAGRWNSVIIFLLIAPQLTSIIMRTFGWRVLLARRGLVNETLIGTGLINTPFDLIQGPSSVVIGLVHVFVPFMVLSIASVLQGIDPRLEESASILGAGRLQTFRRITLPLSLDGVATGAILVFMLTNGSFVTLLLLGGGSITTMPVAIYQQFNLTKDVNFAAAMGNILLLLALACLYLQLRLIKRKGVKS
jgi:putative spermidine/putrescine transport system permease protein